MQVFLPKRTDSRRVMQNVVNVIQCQSELMRALKAYLIVHIMATGPTDRK